MADRIQLRRDTVENWASANPVLAQGEIGIELDVLVNPTLIKIKVGDGTTAWNSLDYYSTNDVNILDSEFGESWNGEAGKAPSQNSLYDIIIQLAKLSDLPSALADLSDDSTHRTVTDTEKSTWNGKAEVDDIPTTLEELTDDATHRTVTDTEKNTWNQKAGPLHNHDTSYAALTHLHDSRYALLSHDHAGVYSLTNHTHLGVYQPIMGTDDNYVTDLEKANLHAPGSDDQDLSGYSLIDHNHDSAISVTYSELTTLISANGLKTGQTYLLTDYATVHYIYGTTTLNTGTTEPLLLTAISNNTLSEIAYSPSYPNDIIYYNISNSNNYVKGATKGHIFRRIDTLQDNEFPFDFRNMLFRRYSTNFPAYSSVTSYSFGAIVSDGYKAYMSLQNNNQNKALSNATWWVLMYSNLNFAKMGAYSSAVSLGPGSNQFVVNASSYSDYKVLEPWNLYSTMYGVKFKQNTSYYGIENSIASINTVFITLYYAAPNRIIFNQDSIGNTFYSLGPLSQITFNLPVTYSLFIGGADSSYHAPISNSFISDNVSKIRVHYLLVSSVFTSGSNNNTFIGGINRSIIAGGQGNLFLRQVYSNVVASTFTNNLVMGDKLDYEIYESSDNKIVDETVTYPTFLNLTDTPSSYSGKALMGVRVNAGGTGLEFTDLPTGGGSSYSQIELGRVTFNSSSLVTAVADALAQNTGHFLRTFPQINELFSFGLPIHADLHYSQGEALDFITTWPYSTSDLTDFIIDTIPTNLDGSQRLVITYGFMVRFYLVQDSSRNPLSKLYTFNFLYGHLHRLPISASKRNVLSLYNRWDPNFTDFAPQVAETIKSLIVSCFDVFLGTTITKSDVISNPDLAKTFNFASAKGTYSLWAASEDSLTFDCTSWQKFSAYCPSTDTVENLANCNPLLFSLVASKEYSINNSTNIPLPDVSMTPDDTYTRERILLGSRIRVYHFSNNPQSISFSYNFFIIKAIGIDSFKIPKPIVPINTSVSWGVRCLYRGSAYRYFLPQPTSPISFEYIGLSIIDNLFVADNFLSIFPSVMKKGLNAGKLSFQVFTYDHDGYIHGFSPVIKLETKISGSGGLFFKIENT